MRYRRLRQTGASYFYTLVTFQRMPLWPHSTFPDWVARGVYDESWGRQDTPSIPAWAARE